MDNQYRTNEFLNDMVSNTANKTSLLQTDLKGFKYIKNVKIRQLNQFLRLGELENNYASDIAYQIEKQFLKGNIEIKKYTVKISESLVMPVYVTNPVQANGRTVLYLHGHDHLGVKGAFTICANKEPYHKNLNGCFY